ncbi:hypothetical protein AcV7_007047 [Taiwanofungus camphoratus]|nr:hypothetical protein AcV7_007047 [Antrodia cinnamomea]
MANVEIREDDGVNDMEWKSLLDNLQEDTAFMHAIQDIVGSKWKPHWYKDNWTWHQQHHNMNENWQPLIPALVDAYLAWCYSTEVSLITDNIQTSITPLSPFDFSIDVLDIYTLD